MENLSGDLAFYCLQLKNTIGIAIKLRNIEFSPMVKRVECFKCVKFQDIFSAGSVLSEHDF